MKKNIFINRKPVTLPYSTPSSGPIKNNFPIRDRLDHSKKIEAQLSSAWEKLEDTRNVITSKTEDGVYIQIKGSIGFELKTKSLENLKPNKPVRLLNIKELDDQTVATIFVPNEQKDYFQKKIEKYKESETSEEVISTIESLQLGLVEDLWTSNINLMPQEHKEWCEIWLLYEKKDEPNEIIKAFEEICDNHQIEYKKNLTNFDEIKAQALIFPERIIIPVFVNKNDLMYIQSHFSKIAEIRKLPSMTSFIMNNSHLDQIKWVEDITERIDLSNQGSTSIAILDTGIAQGHPMIEPFLKENHMDTVLTNSADVFDNSGHGTKMAGIAIYNDIEHILQGHNDLIEINHYIESIKILENGNENKPELYGYLTQQAISLLEINNPELKNRVITMAVTTEAETIDDGRPTSYSAAIDAIVADSNNLFEEREPKLFFISAGNTLLSEIYDSKDPIIAQINHSVENPGQSWNAITVGAYTEKGNLPDELDDFYPVSVPRDISPFNSTSFLWDEKRWPVKPDIVFEGGNLAAQDQLNGDVFYTELDELSGLSTSREFYLGNSFEPFNMTSYATAQASNFAAQIIHQYPDYWPETIRALLIHSAEWTDEMKKSLLTKKTKKDYRDFVRICGYGVPNLERAILSSSNRVNMIIEDEIQPYIKETSGVKTNDMKLHSIPWPMDILQSLGNIPVRLRVTLSYYIDPAPGEVGWKDKYRYQSCGLRFDVKNSDENTEMFLQRINKAIRDTEYENSSTNISSRWLLGVNTRNNGSIHSDIWEGTAIELSTCDEIAVYPVQGWWKTRPHLNKFDSKMRYSLIVTIETEDAENDLYSEIENIIANDIEISTQLEI